MIYVNVINEAKFNNRIKSQFEIMNEYYKNEIDFLHSIIEYKDQCINESYDIQSIEEGFIGNMFEKLKEILRNFIDWIKSLFGGGSSSGGNSDKKYEEQKKKIEESIKKSEKDVKDMKNTNTQEKIEKILVKEIKKNKEVKQDESGNRSYYTYFDESLIMPGVKHIFSSYADIGQIIYKLEYSPSSLNYKEETEKLKNRNYEEIYNKAIDTIDKSETKQFFNLLNTNEFNNLFGLNWINKLEELHSHIEKEAKELGNKITKFYNFINSATKSNKEFDSEIYNSEYFAMCNAAVYTLKTEISYAYKYLNTLSQKKYQGVYVMGSNIKEV